MVEPFKWTADECNEIDVQIQHPVIKFWKRQKKRKYGEKRKKQIRSSEIDAISQTTMCVQNKNIFYTYGYTYVGVR